MMFSAYKNINVKELIIMRKEYDEDDEKDEMSFEEAMDLFYPNADEDEREEELMNRLDKMF